MNLIESKYQLILFGDSNPHSYNLKGMLSERMSSLGMDMDKLMSYPPIPEFRVRNMPTLGIYFETKETIESEKRKDEKNIKVLQDEGTPIVTVVGVSEKYNEEQSSLLPPDDYFTLTSSSSENYLKLADYVLDLFGLLDKKKVLVNYAEETPSKVVKALSKELALRNYDVDDELYQINGNKEFEETCNDRLADSEILIFFHTSRSLKDPWVQARLAYAARLQVGVVEVMESDNVPPYGGLNKQVRLDKIARLNYGRAGAAARLADIVEHWRIANRAVQIENLTGALCKYIKRLSTIDWKLHPGHWVSSYQYDKTCYYVPAIGVTHPECFDVLSARAKRLTSQNGEKEKMYLLYDGLCMKTHDEAYRKQLDGYSPVELMDVRKFFPVRKPQKPKNVFLLVSFPSPWKKADQNYFRTINLLAVRNAIRAFFAMLPPDVMVHLAAHPSVLWLIDSILKWRGQKPKNCVKVYKHDYFIGMYPNYNEMFKDCTVLADGQNETNDETGAFGAVYDKMLAVDSYDAGVVIGGAAGDIAVAFRFIERYKDTVLVPVSLTGGVAKELYDRHRNMIKCPTGIKDELENEAIEYQYLFRAFFEALQGVEKDKA